MLRKVDQPTFVICLIAMLNSMGLGLIVPVMPELLSELGDGSIANAAAIGGYLSLVFAAMQFVFSPILGALSDRFGRRTVLIGSLGLAAADYLLMAMAPHLWMIFIGRMLSGASSATFSVANAYLADRSSEQDRAKSFGIVGAAAGIGFVMGPFIGGLLGVIGPRAPFLAASVLSLLALLGTLKVLRESLSEEERRPISWGIVNPLAPLLRRAAGKSTLLFAVFFLDVFAGFVFPAVWVYFGAVRFGWDSTMIGLSLGLMGLYYALFQAVLLGRLTSWMGNLHTARLAIFTGTIGFLALVWLQSGWVALALLPLFAFRGIAATAIISESSVHVDQTRQGELQGTFASILALASLVAYPVMTQLFAAQLSGAPDDTWTSGTPFLLAAALSALALMLLVFAGFWRRGTPERTRGQTNAAGLSS